MPRFHAASLRKFGEALLESKGMSAADAATVAERTIADKSSRAGARGMGFTFSIALRHAW